MSYTKVGTINSKGHTNYLKQLCSNVGVTSQLIENEEGIKAFLSNPDYGFGYLVAPDGVVLPAPPLSLDDSDEIAQEPDLSPYCSCGSFLQQKTIT